MDTVELYIDAFKQRDLALFRNLEQVVVEADVLQRLSSPQMAVYRVVKDYRLYHALRYEGASCSAAAVTVGLSCHIARERANELIASGFLEPHPRRWQKRILHKKQSSLKKRNH